MKALMKKEMRLSRTLLLIWMGVVLLLCGFAYFEYLSLRETLGELAELINTFPKILTIMFGVGEELTSTLGWYGCIYFWVAILNYSYAIYLGVSCVAKETVHGTAEYLFTKPIRRSKIVAAKALSGVCNLLILTVFSGLCSYFTAILPLGGLEQPGAAVTTTIGMFLTEVVLFAIGLLISSLVRTYKNAARLGAGVLLGFYGLYVIADYLEMPALHYLTPLKYFDVYAVARGGFSVSFLMISIVIVICAVVKSQRSWANREI
ncbi:ABC transporter permease subunit [Anaerotruncus rubiinfantis]|uniref:ABC transporter permease subunit n=1 Tax=Anaerotruncus rubiinfantis TaxID=1720200 RepID=UPI0034A26F9A